MTPRRATTPSPQRIDNWPLLEEVLAFIVQNPEQYDQMYWGPTPAETAQGCGSTRCIAGWLPELAGLKLDAERSAQAGESYYRVTPELRERICSAYPHWAFPAHLESFFIPKVATGLLTNNTDGAEQVHTLLFGAELTWREILENVANLARHDGYRLENPVLLAEYTERRLSPHGTDYIEMEP